MRRLALLVTGAHALAKPPAVVGQKLHDVATPACERRLLEWLGDGRPLSPTKMLAPSGLKLEAPYGSSARGRLVVGVGLDGRRGRVGPLRRSARSGRVGPF